MAGHGPPPKPADQRARGKRSDVIPLRVITQEEKVLQPPLPAGVDWHIETELWWAKLPEDPLFQDLTLADWAYLKDTALVHNAFWKGDMKAAAELRLRLANFGATPADRARLRVTVVQATDAEEKSKARGNIPTSRSKYSQPKSG